MTDSFHGFPPRPNLTGYSAIPNSFFDEVLPKINNMSELKILLAVFRKTYGWVKEIDQNTGQPIYKLEDEISYTQFEKLTGLSSTSIATGLTRAQNNGYIEKVQQGTYNGTSSAYRIVTTDGTKPKPQSPAPKQKEEPTAPIGFTPQKLNLGDEEVSVPKTIKGTSLADITGGLVNGKPAPPKSEKDQILDDIFGNPPPQPEPKESQVTPHQQFIKEWYRCYYSTQNIKYPNPTGKEHGHIKALLKDYDIGTLIKAMEFYFNHYKEGIGTVPVTPPTLTIFYSWRTTIIPASVNGIVPKAGNKQNRNAREFDENKWEDDFFDN